ncbi:hypothetical protein [Streptomyces sp. NBC_01190]|uniref:hypothetical protein n=1 Tax=Streptomyces sp. NBC_01190 TaxID=2903767 RepID=UPI0038652EC2|nr:hypothetical protein OG519_33210 [Streptomyces sp. NBC_01190]
MTTDSSPAPEGEPAIPDDVWDQFLQDNERDIRASAPKEPSARARLVARRLREEEERAAAASKRRRRWRGLPITRAGLVRRGRSSTSSAWRSGATDAAERRLRRRGRVRALLGIVLVVILVLIVLAPGRSWSFVRGNGWHDGSAAQVPARLVRLAPAGALPDAGRSRTASAAATPTAAARE